MNVELTDPNRAAAETIGETLPAMREDIPAPVRPPGVLSISGVIIGSWFLPGRFGPRLALVSWLESAVVAVICLILGASTLIYDYQRADPYQPIEGVQPVVDPDARNVHMPFGEYLRVPLANMVITAQKCALEPEGPMILTLVVLFLMASPFVAAIVLMPLAAAGDALRPLYFRCLKQTLWSATVLIPIAVIVILWPHLRHAFGIPPSGAGESPLLENLGTGENRMDMVDFAMLTVLAGWWYFVWRHGALAYAGPTVGPGWQRVRPRCHRCGYILAGLPVDGSCPECNSLNAVSLKKQRAALKFTPINAFRAALRAARMQTQRSD